jgi:hypothetical protein
MPQLQMCNGRHGKLTLHRMINGSTETRETRSTGSFNHSQSAHLFSTDGTPHIVTRATHCKCALLHIILCTDRNIENHLVWPIVRNSKYLEKTTFGKLDLFPSSGEGKETTSLFGPLQSFNLEHCTSDSMHLG